jgi:non-heme chloroperoxidase
MPFINIGDENGKEIMLHFEDHGHGEPLLMIHGYPFSGMAWEKQVSFFVEKGYRVITYDRRGFGHSSKTMLGYDYDTFTNDLKTIIDRLNLSNLTLVGHSMGTGEVTRYIARYGSSKVKAAVLVSPIPPYILKADDNKNGIDRKVFEGFKDAIKKDRYAFISEFLKNFYNLSLLNHGVSEEKLRADFNLASLSSPTAFLKCVDTWLTDFRQDLRKINVPLLVIHGDKDNILPFENTAKLIPDYVKASVKVISGGSHGIPWTHADDISVMILDFMKREVIDKDLGTSAQLH